MRSVLLACCLAACGFEHGAVPGAQTDARGSAAADAMRMVDASGPPGDRDGDGVADGVDKCPDTPDPDQKDTDGDNHGDACDHCPHLPSSNDPDSDGDTIGDACDPNPSIVGDVRVAWITFDNAAVIATWTKAGTWTVANGWVSIAGASSGVDTLRYPADIPRAFVQTSMRLDDFTSTSAAAGLATAIVGAPGSVSQFNQCALFHSGPQVNARTYSSGNVVSDSYQSYAGSIVNTTVVPITAQFIASTFSCSVGATTQTANLGSTNGIVEFLNQRGNVSFDYLFIVNAVQ